MRRLFKLSLQTLSLQTLEGNFFPFLSLRIARSRDDASDGDLHANARHHRDSCEGSREPARRRRGE
jgi:hypothetical protein